MGLHLEALDSADREFPSFSTPQEKTRPAGGALASYRSAAPEAVLQSRWTQRLLDLHAPNKSSLDEQDCPRQPMAAWLELWLRD